MRRTYLPFLASADMVQRKECGELKCANAEKENWDEDINRRRLKVVSLSSIPFYGLGLRLDQSQHTHVTRLYNWGTLRSPHITK